MKHPWLHPMKSSTGDILVVSIEETTQDYAELAEVEYNLWNQLGCPDFISGYIVEFGVNSTLFNEVCTTAHNPNWSEFIQLLIFKFGFNSEIEKLSIKF